MTTITIDRALLEQALKAFESGLTMPKWSGIVADIRAELAKPAKASQTASQLAATVLSDCGISTDCTALLMVVEARIAQHEEEMIDSLQKLAKPVERVEPITLDQFRAIAHRTATTYRHRSDPEKSSYAFVDGSSLDDFWRKVCEAIQPTSAWHDAPEVADLKAQRNELLALLIYASSEIKSEYPESQWSEYRVFEMEAAIAKAGGETE